MCILRSHQNIPLSHSPWAHPTVGLIDAMFALESKYPPLCVDSKLPVVDCNELSRGVSMMLTLTFFPHKSYLLIFQEHGEPQSRPSASWPAEGVFDGRHIGCVAWEDWDEWKITRGEGRGRTPTPNSPHPHTLSRFILLIPGSPRSLVTQKQYFRGTRAQCKTIQIWSEEPIR